MAQPASSPAGLIDPHVAFVAALRTAGLPVSLVESLDATQAMATVDIRQREQLRAGYAACVVKRAAHRASFDRLFDLWWPPAIGDGTTAYDDGAPDPDGLEDVEPQDVEAI